MAAIRLRVGVVEGAGGHVVEKDAPVSAGLVAEVGNGAASARGDAGDEIERLAGLVECIEDARGEDPAHGASFEDEGPHEPEYAQSWSECATGWCPDSNPGKGLGVLCLDGAANVAGRMRYCGHPMARVRPNGVVSRGLLGVITGKYGMG